MKDKLLIFEQEYDVISFYEIIERDELESYTQEWIDKHIEHQNNYMPHRYLHHNINTESGTVSVRFEHDEYGDRGDGSKFPAGEYWKGFSYIDLEKIPVWKKQ